mgnify:CR=1 FL=1
MGFGFQNRFLLDSLFLKIEGRVLLNQLGFEEVKVEQNFHFDSLTNATVLLEELTLVSEIDTRLRGFCDLSFLFFYKELFVDFARLFYASKKHRHRFF